MNNEILQSGEVLSKYESVNRLKTNKNYSNEIFYNTKYVHNIVPRHLIRFISTTDGSMTPNGVQFRLFTFFVLLIIRRHNRTNIIT